MIVVSKFLCLLLNRASGWNSFPCLCNCLVPENAVAPQLLLDPASIASKLQHSSLYAFQCYTMSITDVLDGAMSRLSDVRSPLIGSSVAASACSAAQLCSSRQAF